MDNIWSNLALLMRFGTKFFVGLHRFQLNGCPRRWRGIPGARLAASTTSPSVANPPVTR